MSRRRDMSVLAAVVLAVLALAACGTGHRRLGPVQTTAALAAPAAGGQPAQTTGRVTGGQSARGAAPAIGGPPTHIALVVMENKEYGEIIGASAAPYINHLAHEYALASSMFAISHPSLPNYLALTGGSTFGITSDCTGCSTDAPSLVDQLGGARISWKAYLEDLPHPCFAGPQAGEYAKKHDPLIYYSRIATRPSLCRQIVPLTQLAADERDGRLPTFIWITPNLCHDMHDCAASVGDQFLSKLVPPLLHALGSGGLLFVTWDEGVTDDGCCRLAAGGHIATIVAGPGARRGARLTIPVDHYSTLRTIEDLLGLPRLRGAACSCTRSLGPLLVDKPARRTG
jgi:hypothetical protein